MFNKYHSDFKESRSNFVVWTETLSAFILGSFVSWFIVIKSGFVLWIFSVFDSVFL